MKVLQAAKEHLAKEESVGCWTNIRSRQVFKSTSPHTSPPAEELIDVSALKEWSPQVCVFSLVPLFSILI